MSSATAMDGGLLSTTLSSLPLLGIAVLPVCLLVLPDAAEVIYTLVSLTGLFYLLRQGVSANEYRRLFLVSLLPLLFFSVAALSVLVSGDYNAWFRPLKKLAELLTTPFIALLLLRANIAPRYFLLTAKLSALLIFAVALYQFSVLHIPRPGGAISPLPFAHVALLLGCFSLINLPLENTRQKLFSLASFSAGYLSVVVSQSRIEWVNAFILIATLLMVWFRSGLLGKRTLLSVTIAILPLTLLSVSVPFVQQRVISAYDHYQGFRDHESWNDSVGQRFIMWRHGLAAAAQKPVFGWGIHRSQQAAVAGIRDPDIKQTLGEHHNLHNEYVNSLAAKGIVGLASLLALLLVPLSVFLARSGNRELLVFNAGGILLCVSYVVSGMTFQAFGDDTMNIFFVIVLAYTLTSTPACPAGKQRMHRRADCCRHRRPAPSEP